MAEGSEDGNGGGSAGSIPDFVAQCYYRYGLLVATHSKKVILLAIVSFYIICTPLWYLPLPGYLPQNFITPLHNYTLPAAAPEGGIRLDPSPTPTPLWYQGPPKAYIQQIVVRAGVVGWKEGLVLSDVYRGPLSSVFHLAQTVSDYQLASNRSCSFGSECLLIEEVVKKYASAGGVVLPHYNCLMLSPADLWERNINSFHNDPNVLNTVDSLLGHYEGQTNIADILFGVPSREIGFRKRRNPKRAITYAVTLALKQYNEDFVNGLEKELTSRYPVHQPVQPERQEIIHIYFPTRVSLWEYLIIFFYCVIFSSIYFSILKMDMFKSKLGMSVSVLVTLIASLCLSIGICAYFGLRPLQSKGKYIYPVLAGLVGFENSMVLIRSVLNTPQHLDIKIRVAQGLAREGWNITRYFIVMITIVTVAFFLFIPLVQEICIYGGVILLCDIFMQMVFLTSVLAIDLHRYEETEENRKQTFGMHSANPLFRYHQALNNSNVRLLPSQSEETSGVPNLHRRTPVQSVNGIMKVGQDRLAQPQPKQLKSKELPKRLRITDFVVKTRFFQRIFICAFVAWISWIIYSSGLINQFTEPADSTRFRDLPSIIFSLANRSTYRYNADISQPELQDLGLAKSPASMAIQPTLPSYTNNTEKQQNESLKLLKHRTRTFWRKLPHTHWTTLFSYYNISVTGSYLSILPPILLSLPLSPDEAHNVQNANDPNNLKWPADAFTIDEPESSDTVWDDESVAFVPSSRNELLVAAVLLIPAVITLIYGMVALYRCVCSRNYAEWRASWWGDNNSHGESTQIIGEALPLVLAGHPHDVECLCTDGVLLVSSCLAGVIRVWDPSTGECVSTINRARNELAPGYRMGSPEGADDPHSDYESGSPPSQPDIFKKTGGCQDKGRGNMTGGDEDDSDNEILETTEVSKGSYSRKCSTNNYFHAFPDLTPSIDLHFHSQSADTYTTEGFSHFDNYYEEHKKLLKDEIEYQQRRGRKTSDSLDYSPTNVNNSIKNTKMIRSPSYTEGHRKHVRNLSAGNLSLGNIQHGGSQGVCSGTVGEYQPLSTCNDPPPIWCLESQDSLVFVGCGTGRLEVWDFYNSVLKCIYEDGSGAGVTSMKLSGNRIMLARLNGSIDMLRLESLASSNTTSNNTNKPQHTFRPGHSRGNSRDLGVGSGSWTFSYDEPLKVMKYAGVRAHQQPITVITTDHTRLITGSHDHTLKVWSMSDGSALFTLHGHCGPITSLFINGSMGLEAINGDVTVDLGMGAIIASGSQDGMLCVWEVVTGACVYSVQAHDGSITTLNFTSSYILSLGTDEKLCVWERFQGHLLNTLTMTQMYCSSMVMLTNKLLITSRQGSLTVWDITAGVPVRVVRLGDSDDSVFIRHMMPVADTIVCDYGNQLRLVKLPVADKYD